MPLAGKSAEEISVLEGQLLDGVPDDGTSIGNKRLRDEVLKWEIDLYLAVRDRLIDDGSLIVGRGKGGSVRRLIDEVPPEPIEVEDQVKEPAVAEPARAAPFPDESSLYGPMTEVIRDRWIRDQRFEVVPENRTGS